MRQYAPNRVISPSILREPTVLESLASTLSTWSPFPSTTGLASNAGSSPSHASTKLPKSSQRDTAELALSSQMGMDEADPSLHSLIGRQEALNEDAEDLTETSNGEAGTSGTPAIVWSGWDRLRSSDGEQMRRILMIGYASNGFSIWDCSNLGPWSELLSIPSLDICLGAQYACLFPRSIGAIVGASILPDPTASTSDKWKASRPLLAILTRQDKNGSEVDSMVEKSNVILYSLSLRTTAPLALIVLSSTTFLPESFSPLIDLSPSPFNNSPVFDLGRGGRFLAYATTTRIPAPSQPSSTFIRSGSGIRSQNGTFDIDDSNDLDNATPASDSGRAIWNDGKIAQRVGGEVARKVGEVALSGAKTISEIGMSYWIPRASAVTVDGSESGTGTKREFSISAPLPTLSKLSNRSNTSQSHSTSSDGIVRVLDLASVSRKVVAHFRPTTSPLAIVSLSPSSSFILTASFVGRAFDIFELRPNVDIGRSSTLATTCLAPLAPAVGKVWHRYRLHRGLTGGRVVSVNWSDDTRLIGIETDKGTNHIFAIHPSGGKVTPESQFATQTCNVLELQPLSTSLEPIARLRKPSMRYEDVSSGTPIPQMTTIPTSLAFVSKADSMSSSFSAPNVSSPGAPSSPSSHLRRSPRPSSTSLPTNAGAAMFQDCLVFDPAINNVVLHRLANFPAPISVEVAASRAVSGISKLMNNRGNTAPMTKLAWQVRVTEKAAWNLARPNESDSMPRAVAISEGSTAPRLTPPDRYGAQIEIETFSRSSFVLPRSIYLSNQFTFHSIYPISSLPHRPSVIAYSLLPHLRRLELRTDVQLAGAVPLITSGSPSSSFSPRSSSSNLSPPALSLSSSYSSSPHSRSTGTHLPSSFEEPLHIAMTTVSTSPSRPSSFPQFPNGIAGKQGNWSERNINLNLNLNSVGPVINDGITRVRQGMARVRSAQRSASGNREERREVARLTSEGSVGSSAISISFEDDDAVFASKSMMEEDCHEVYASRLATGMVRRSHPEEDSSAGASSHSTGWTSEPEEGLVIDAKMTMNPRLDLRAEDLPFEDDFDDFVRGT